MSNRKHKTERIQDELGFGFDVAWSWHDGCANFEVRALEVSGESVSPPVSEPSDEVYLRGFVRWDGCSEIRFAPDQSETCLGDYHWCGWNDWRAHMQLLGHLYVAAFELMGCEPNEHLDPGGLQVYRAAVAARDATEPKAAETPLSRYEAALQRLADFPDTAQVQGIMETARLDGLLREIEDLYRQLSDAERANVTHPPLRR